MLLGPWSLKSRRSSLRAKAKQSERDRENRQTDNKNSYSGRSEVWERDTQSRRGKKKTGDPRITFRIPGPLPIWTFVRPEARAAVKLSVVLCLCLPGVRPWSTCPHCPPARPLDRHWPGCLPSRIGFRWRPSLGRAKRPLQGMREQYWNRGLDFSYIGLSTRKYSFKSDRIGGNRI